MNFDNLLKIGKTELKKNSILNYNLDSEILLSQALKISRENLILNLNKTVNKFVQQKYFNLIKKRSQKIPIAYILGYKEFWKSKFIVNKSVLIPRPETELLVEQALKLINKDSKLSVLDIGTGTGCILISILKERKFCRGLGIDISKLALNNAKSNAKMQQLENRIKFIKSDIDNFFTNKYDFILSNPPYINKFKLKSLMDDVKMYEPSIALDGGINGCSVLKKVIKKSAELIKIKGKLILEIDNNQLLFIKGILMKYNFIISKVIKDLRGYNRCIIATKI